MSSYITLLDPSLSDHKSNLSHNLGDTIIYESVSKYLKEIFTDSEIIRISTHSFLEKKHYNLINKSLFTFIGGSNILSSNIRQYNQWKLSTKKLYYLFPKIGNIILLGVGWWQYQNDPDFVTKHFYKRVLSSNWLHSVRDSYTKQMLHKIKMQRALNTSCPTTWELQGFESMRNGQTIKNCLFTITDYNQNIILDEALISLLLEFYTETIFFYPQGTLDNEYLQTLENYRHNKSRFKILDRNPNIINEFKKNEINYIGTRLHGGIKCMQNGINSVIIAIDNRAMEINKDINLPVIERNNIIELKKWLEGEKVFKPINTPIQNIIEWKEQFN